MKHADSQDVLQSTCRRLESTCRRLQNSGIAFLKSRRRDFRSQSRSWVFIFWRTFSLIKGSYFDQYHCGEPVISSKCEDKSGEETRESWLKLLFFTDDRPKTDCEDSATYLGSASTKRFVRFLG
jgi:hypothetical protein